MTTPTEKRNAATTITKTQRAALAQIIRQRRNRAGVRSLNVPTEAEIH